MANLRGTLAAGVVFLGGLVAWGANAAPDQTVATKSPHDSPADRLVHEALAAEMAGDNERREALLVQALEEDPNCRAARWQSGYVHLDGKWLTPHEAGQKYAADSNLAEYRRRRDAAVSAGLISRGSILAPADNTDDGTAHPATSVEVDQLSKLSRPQIDGNAELARWCRTKRLTDEERAHWTQVLSEEPKNNEAQARLGMRWFMGGLYTSGQIDAIKTQRATEEKQLAQWKPTISRWRKALNDGTAAGPSDAAGEMMKIKDAAIIPALEWADSSDSPRRPAYQDAATPFQREAVELLGRLPEQRATYSLVQHSVMSPQSEVRARAADELSNRPLHDFVPILLSGLANPIEFDYATSFDPTIGLMAYQATASQEGRETIQQVESSRFQSGLRLTTLSTSRATAPPSQGQISATSIDGRNARIELMNERINSVMEKVAQKFPGRLGRQSNNSDAIPEAAITRRKISVANRWWHWWAEHNEAFEPKKRVFVRRDRTYRLPQDQMMSCFAAGTPIVTQTGPVAIETLQIGDCVLAQDVNTGELAFKPVLGTTVRPPVEMALVTTTRGAVRTTRGHPFWIVGKGWRMAKELELGDRVHSLDGGETIAEIHDEPPALAYNLIVADFGTYFVGEGQILVHDNTPRLPTTASIPGLVADFR